MLVKYFNKNQNVELKKVDSLQGIEKNKIIRVIPEIHIKLVGNNIKAECIELNQDNVKMLSEGDMVILHDKGGSTYWHETYFNEEIQELCLKGYSLKYASVEDLLNSTRYDKINVRNDMYIAEYARKKVEA